MLTVTEQAFGTDTGRHRSANEDSYLVRPPAFVVADGMGGAQAGEVASHTAVQSFNSHPPGDQAPEEFLRERIEAANSEIHRLADGDESMAGMGTTMTAVLVAGAADEVVIGHVGDSRAYRFREGRLEQLTRDHSLVEEMRRKGQITDEQAETHPQRSVITRALGPEPSVLVDVQTVPAREDDVYLLCSDGLTTMVDDSHIEAALAGPGTLQGVIEGLIRAANDAGGRDNITVGAFRVGAASAEGASSPAVEHPTLIGGPAAAAGLDAEEIRKSAGRRGAAGKRGRGVRGAGKRSRTGDAARNGGSRGRTILRRTIKTLAALVLIGAVGVGAYVGARQVWFVSTDEAGRVALYQGLPYELPFGIELYSDRYSIPVQTGSLSGNRLESVTGHDLRSRSDAVSLIEDIDRATLTVNRQ